MKYAYMSDRDKDYACLERQLSECAASYLKDHVEHGIYPDRKSVEPYLEDLAKALKIEYKDAVAELYRIQELPTRYDNPFNFTILDGLVRELNGTIDRLGIPLSEFPLYASIPTGEVNASANKFECSDKKFILFDSQLFTYCNLFAKAFALAVPHASDGCERYSYSVEAENIVKNLSPDHESVVRLYDVLSAMHTSGKPSRAKPYVSEIPHVRLSEVIRRGMEIFIVAHEFGHVYANHLGEISRRLGYISEHVRRDPGMHKVEYEADAIALQLTLATMSFSGLDMSLSYIGIDLLFGALMLNDRFANVCKGGSDVDYSEVPCDTHPTSLNRRDFMRNTLNSSRVIFGDAINFASVYELVLNEMWKCVLLRHRKVSKLNRLKRLQK